jgi:PAS domain S-box-containing protein
MGNSNNNSRSGNQFARKRAIPLRAPVNVAGVELTRAADSDVDEDRERYLDLFNFAPVAYVRLDRNGVIDEINQAGCRLLSAPQGLLLSRPLLVFVERQSRVSFLEHMRRCRATDDVVASELTLVAKDQRTVHVHAYTKRSPADTGGVYWTVLVDITDSRLLDRARMDAEKERLRAEHEQRLSRQTNAATHRFLNVLSHELRTPLTPSLFAASRLLESDMPEGVRRLGAIIKRNIQNEARLIDDLLDVSRIERGALRMTFDPVNLHEILNQAIEACLPQIGTKPVTLSAVLNASRHMISGDPGRLRQVFSNLITNAIKFTDSGRIEVRSTNDEAGGVRVIVSDTGIGIAPDDFERLFTSFEQHRGQSSRGGLGLGLAICRGVIDAHKGRIWATSRGPGEGSTFEVELSVAAEATSTPREPRPRHSPDSVCLRILVVEDDNETANMLEDVLDYEGHQFDVVHTVREARAQANRVWDVIISDLGLPDGSGFDVAARFSSAVPRPRMIALSGYGTESDLQATGTAGFERHLVKPIDLDQLRSALDS